MTLNTLKMQIVCTAEGRFHFVDHERKLMTMGFSTEDSLKHNADILCDNAGARELMSARYKREYPNES